MSLIIDNFLPKKYYTEADFYISAENLGEIIPILVRLFRKTFIKGSYTESFENFLLSENQTQFLIKQLFAFNFWEISFDRNGNITDIILNDYAANRERYKTSEGYNYIIEYWANMLFFSLYKFIKKGSYIKVSDDIETVEFLFNGDNFITKYKYNYHEKEGNTWLDINIEGFKIDKPNFIEKLKLNFKKDLKGIYYE